MLSTRSESLYLGSETIDLIEMRFLDFSHGSIVVCVE